MEFKVHVNTLIKNQYDNFLFVREKKSKIYGKLNLPGGHLEFNETIIQCAYREIQEETGLTVNLGGLISITSTVVEGFYAIGFVFVADSVTNEININCDDIIECLWLSLDDISKINDDQFVNPIKIRAAIDNLQKGNLVNYEYIDQLIKKY
jgi:8-oxo-dGTP diphosphatase